MFLGWGKWTLIVGGVLGMFICGGMMILGRRNRSSTAVDGATGIPWVLGGLTLGAIGGRPSSAWCCDAMAHRMSDDIAARARRRTRAVVAAAIAAVVLVIAAVGGRTGRRCSGTGADPVPEPASRSGYATGAHRGTARAVGVSAGIGRAAGTDVAWTTVAGARVPVSATAGPARHRRRAGPRLRAHARWVRCSPRRTSACGCARRSDPTCSSRRCASRWSAPTPPPSRQQLDDDYQQARAQLGLPYGAAGRPPVLDRPRLPGRPAQPRPRPRCGCSSKGPARPAPRCWSRCACTCSGSARTGR